MDEAEVEKARETIRKFVEKQTQPKPDPRITVLGGCISAFILFPITIANKIAAVAFLVERHLNASYAWWQWLVVYFAVCILLIGTKRGEYSNNGNFSLLDVIIHCAFSMTLVWIFVGIAEFLVLLFVG